MIQRTNCAICEDNNFTEVFNIISTIDFVSSNNYSDEEIITLDFFGCLTCGCVQLKKLYDPLEIYAQPMQCFNGPSLNKHYELLADFIIKNKIKPNSNFFEIGGSYGRLAKLIINKQDKYKKLIKYTILEFDINNYPPIQNVHYVSGNCETHDFSNIDTLIMSHVFEHLYNPRQFFKKISDANIKEFFISIPDMKGLLEIGDINNLNIYHTFFIDSNFIIFLFEEYNYSLKDTYNYENNSIFYYFVKQDNMTNLTKTIKNIENKELIEVHKDFYTKIKKQITEININKPFFICPSGHYGRFIYYYMQNDVKNKVIGFLDSDPMKIGKRLCGTPYLSYEKQEIKKYINPFVLIVSNKHIEEIKNELLIYNNTITFYYLH